MLDGLRLDDRADAVDVALHDVAAEPRVRRDGALEVDPAAGPQRAEAAAVEGLAHHVDRLHRRRDARDPRPQQPRRPGARRPGQPGAPDAARRRGSAATSCRATSTAPARSSRATPSEHWDVVRVSLPADLARYVVDKGSITVDGVSLTVAAVDDRSFTVSLIPTTLALTTLGRKQAGDPVNLEVDVLAKYVERLLAPAPSSPSPEAGARA